ncbi:MSMEG_1061 family FMN-dependent PPOX-type flavoprotein [Kordiimonas gwangyangensis]|uniref:MSMEG_1061 family FMN-dependent PPOX-type flavoprotein n=1 Tax=Kordiimonas gwangyangensis TaxID=288022 RepID=UPI000362EDF5|nr:MSMEG_1061 family FMN-dependent PPOX-type flavoprotein [Kordiimonas gwangyangensis]
MAQGRIETIEALRAHYGYPSDKGVEKELSALDKHCKRFIELSPFLMLATTNGDKVDVTPRGDAPGSVQVVGDSTILVPDWPGNRRLDSLSNILAHPNVSLIFLIPNVSETLRVLGSASIIVDEELRARFETKGKIPLSVISVEVKSAFLHCSKAFLRSKLWQSDSWPERSALASAGEMFRDHMELEMPVEDLDRIVDGFKNELY